MKIYLIICLILIFFLNSKSLVYCGEPIPIMLQSVGGIYGTSFISIGKQQISAKSRGVTAIAFNPTDANTLKILAEDTHHWTNESENPSKSLLKWLKQIESFSPGWVVAMVSNDDSFISMSLDLKTYISKFGLNFGFRGSWLLVLQTNGINYKNLGSSFSLIADSTVSKGPIFVSVN
ncbi:hypothetical protein ACTFIZ_005513 [Dictyostelium cf. discoideum]